MTELLEKAFAEAEKLSPEEQNALAKLADEALCGISDALLWFWIGWHAK